MSIYGKGIFLGGGGSAPTNATVTINAPKNSWIIYSGQSSGIIDFGTSMQVSKVLTKGNYVFESHLLIADSASTTEDTVIYTKQIGVNNDITVNMYPENYLYWYGLTGSQTGGWYSRTQSAQTFSAHDNYLMITWSGGTSGGSTNGAFRTANEVGFNSSSKIKYRGAFNKRYTTSGNYYPTACYSTTAWTSISGATNPFNHSTTLATNQYGQSEVELTINDGAGYVGVDTVLSSAIVYAIWLE